MSSGLSTVICSMLGIELPILGAPMGGVAGPELVAAVSSAGGLGLLGHASIEPDDMRAQIRATKDLTGRPFGVGLLFPYRSESTPTAAGPAAGSRPPLPPFLRELVGSEPVLEPEQRLRYDAESAQQRLEVAIAEGVSVLALGLGAPDSVVQRAKAHGMTVISLVGSRRAALDVEERGVDIVVAQGHEAGGHTGRVATMVLVPQVVDAVRLPVVAAGGIVDGRGLAAALMLGAAGALIGTRLLATPEARTAPSHKQSVVAMRDDDTVVSRCYTGKPSRVLRNAFTDAWKGHEAEILPMPEQWDCVEPVVSPAKAEGSLDLANWPTGQGAVLVNAIKPAADVVREIAAEAASLIGPRGMPDHVRSA
jgi:NAD(P)H-dependent flavin oxidoreductase YrpB (nitropropane dioxygenase family)